MTKRRRVLAYITRESGGGTQLLVFAHRDHAEAGIQVPAGRVDPGETLEACLRREIEEEAGLTELRLVRELPGFEDHYESRYENHAFHVVLEGPAPDEWDHVVVGEGDDAGLVFQYRWVPLDDAPPLFERTHPLLSTLRPPMKGA